MVVSNRLSVSHVALLPIASTTTSLSFDSRDLCNKNMEWGPQVVRRCGLGSEAVEMFASTIQPGAFRLPSS
jgi:hypothetical protein